MRQTLATSSPGTVAAAPATGRADHPSASSSSTEGADPRMGLRLGSTIVAIGKACGCEADLEHLDRPASIRSSRVWTGP